MKTPKSKSKTPSKKRTLKLKVKSLKSMSHEELKGVVGGVHWTTPGPPTSNSCVTHVCTY